jgi:glycosyltransferase involved in cell wall biosynthesis
MCDERRAPRLSRASGSGAATEALLGKMRDRRLLIISPVYNEAAHLDRCARAIAAQRLTPDNWVVVDDGSTDGTLAVARRWERRLDFLTVLAAGQEDHEGDDNHARARSAIAFNHGLRSARARWGEHELIGKLDGDIELPGNWFSELAHRFDADPGLGLAGGRLEEPAAGGWRTVPIPPTHIHGAVKLYRRRCLEEIGGVPDRLAWDTIDETYARMRGYETRSFPDLVARHHRPSASADGQLRGRARHGECAWILHYGLAWVALRSLKVARFDPPVLSGIAFLYGYCRAAVRRVPQVEDPEFRSFVRRELRGRMLHPLRALAG